MADTSQQQTISEPHTNGVMDGLTEEEKSKIRPADIDADMREMERRKRVEMMMNSRLFREELERIIETQMKDGSGPSGLLQQISDMMGAQGARFNGNVFKNSNCVLPINDIRGVESMGYAKGEKLLRCKLAAVFRLLDLYGWSHGVGGQITARLNQDQEHFLVNPYGLLYHEITASSLIKVDMQGTVVEQGTTNFGVHVAGFQLHSTIHAARPDIKCIVHITTPSVTAISSLKCGLLPIGQESIVIGEVSTHQYVGGSFEPEEKEKIARNLGPMNKVMLLTNRGALCCGETVEEAFFNVYNMVLACETQLKLMPAGLDNLNLISEESKKAIFEASRKPTTPQQQVPPLTESTALAEKLEKRWRIGGIEFEALMRMLDNAGFRTGYIYRNPLVKGEPPRRRNDVEVPPAVSSLGYLLEEEELYKQGLWKGGRKGTDRSRWLNSPNVYQKVEILETGTPDPKKITKWVSDGSPTHSSTPVKIESALQFVPKNTNPKEFKQIQQQIKDYRRADKISAGPQSHILEGVTWEEAKKMQDATISGTGEQVVLVGAASKGIIQRGFQHNAMVYKTPYAKNPFDAVTDQELDQYKKDVERKQKGDPYDESQSESEALSSFNISRATHESSTAKSPIQSPVSVTSETEEESRDEPRVLRIETKQVPAPSQPEVVLSDDRDSPGRYWSQNESEYDNENELEMNDLCVGCKPCNWQCEPRLEIARTDVVAERLVATLIEYSPSPTAARSVEIDGSLYNERNGHTNHVDENDSAGGRCESKLMENGESSGGETTTEKNREVITNSLWIGDTNETAMKQISEMISGIDSRLASSNTRLNTLLRSDSKISTKYSLGPNDMNLIYSLTPFIDSLSEEQGDADDLLAHKEGPVTPGSESDRPTGSIFLRSSEEKDFQNGCTELNNGNNCTRPDTLCDIGSFENDYPEIRSNEGSVYALEPPATSVVLDFLEPTADLFRYKIGDSVNEIIAELELNETYTAISCLVRDVLLRVCETVTDVPSCETSSQFSSLMSFEGCPEDYENASKEIEEKAESNEHAYFYVVEEIIHHVIDWCDESLRELPDALAKVTDDPWKMAKNSANVELKEARNCDASNRGGETNWPINNSVAVTTNDGNELCAVRTPETIDTTEAEVVFEFRTIAKKKWTCLDDKAYELNFRIEKGESGRTADNSEEPGELDCDDEENVDCTVRNQIVRTEYRTDCYVNSNNSLEDDEYQTDSVNVFATQDVESYVECNFYANSREVDDDDEKCSSLTPIDEEDNDGSNSESAGNAHFANATPLNDRTYTFTSTEVHPCKNVAPLEFTQVASFEESV